LLASYSSPPPLPESFPQAYYRTAHQNINQILKLQAYSKETLTSTMYKEISMQ